MHCLVLLCYGLATPCPVLALATVLRTSYTVSGADSGYAATRRKAHPTVVASNQYTIAYKVSETLDPRP
eukprot:144674-Rhodomonas_salina.2